jgi:membrane associated rhomboid family serine protease
MVALLALYNPFDPFFNFFQFISYMFIHSNDIFLHIIFNMFILWILGIHVNTIIGHRKFIIIYFSSGFAAGLLQNMLKILIIYHYTGIFDLFQISHVFISISNRNNRYLQYSMYSPIIGSSGAIASIVTYFIPLITINKIFIINFILYNVIVFFNIFPGFSHLSHFSGGIVGYYISLGNIL